MEVPVSPTSQKTSNRVPISGAEFNPPNNTLYINNLPDKVQPKEMMKILRMLFEPFGEILQIHVRRTLSMRGQAFLVFKQLEDAKEALEDMQGYPIHFKPMCINYSKFRSFVIASLDGTLDQVKSEQSKFKSEKAERPRATRRQVMDQLMSSGPLPTNQAIPHVPSGELPNKVLFIIELPSTVAEEDLRKLFQPFAGFRGIRLVPGRADIALIDFDNELQSTVAKNALDRYQITPESQLKVLYARK